MKLIPFFNYPALFSESEADLMLIIRDVLARGAYIMQEDLFEFESNLARYLGIKHVIGVADGTMALIMGLKAVGIEKGDEVIVPSHTFVASAAAIHHAGAKPILADCGSDHLIDPCSIEKLITFNTRAVMPVQLNGRTANMEKICKLAFKHKLKLVEDSAQALGSKFKGKYAGTFGEIGICSFYPSKTLGGFGDGGAIFTNDDKVARHVKLLRDHGRDNETGNVVTWGFNSRLDNLQAAILNFKFKNYDKSIQRRRQIASLYASRLSTLDDMVLPPSPNSDPDHFDIYQNYEVECGRREKLRLHLHEKGIGTIIQWGGKTIHQFKDLELNDDLPVTEKISKRFFLLPMNTSLSDDEVNYICDQIVSFYKVN